MDLSVELEFNISGWNQTQRDGDIEIGKCLADMFANMFTSTLADAR